MDPKTFYRNLDLLLGKINRERTGKNFLCSILTEFENTFGAALGIRNGRLYEEDVDAFLLVSCGTSSQPTATTRLVTESEGVQRVLKFGSYIYDDPALTIDAGINGQKEYAIPVAFTVHSPENRWIFLFELHSGWVREIVEFCINAVRTAVNFRLFSEAVKSDMEQAAFIQQSLLPPVLQTINGYEFAARSKPAELVGGDLYDYVVFDDQMFGVSIGDASGHGLPAALLVRDVVTGLRMGLEKSLKMAYALEKLNNVIHRSTFSSRFVSVFYGEIENNGNLIYTNAGHPSPLLVTGKRVQELRATGIILGAMPDISLERAYAYFEPNAVLVLYSDGIFERKNRKGKNFGINQLKELIVQNQQKSAQEILNLIFEVVYEFGNREKWEDDATVVVIKRGEDLPQ